MNTIIPRMYYHGSKLCMEIPKNHLFSKNSQELLARYFTLYTNTYMKTAFIGTRLSSEYHIKDVTLESVDMKQVTNVPVYDLVQVSCSMENRYEYMFDSTKPTQPTFTIENQPLHLTLKNDTNELYGYCNEIVEITFARK